MIPNNKKIYFLIFLSVVFSNVFYAQNSTYSPYSRYGLGELNSLGFSHISAMGGTFIGLKPDTAAPIFINVANPAAITGIRLTSLELGGNGQFSEYNNGKTTVTTRNVNFSYGSLGFPIKQKAAACFGIMPYSSVGYNLKNTVDVSSVGNVNYSYSGEGGINKAFLGFGISPFKNYLNRFYKSAYRDSLVSKKQTKAYKKAKFAKELLSELSIGVRADYLFGSILHSSSVVYPNSTNYYHTRRYRAVTYKDVTGSFGLQTSFTIDSVGKRELRKKVKIGVGYFMSIPNSLNVKNSYMAYNYSLNSFGDEIPKDTFIYVIDNPGIVRLPLEQGIGVSFKKGEIIAVAADFSYTNWQQFRYLDAVNDLSNTFRVSAGVNFVPNKYAAGNSAYLKRIQYRLGGFYQSGALELKNTLLNHYAVTVGFGFPVGMYRQYSVVNITGQFGEMGSVSNNLIRERYAKIIIGFTFNDKWFTKFRYD